VLSYYSSAITLNSEGDTSISEETLEGLGRPRSFISILFGAIIKIAETPQKSSRSFPAEAPPATPPEDITPPEAMYEHNQAHFVDATVDPAVDTEDKFTQSEDPFFEDVATLKKKSWLTEILPDPGYFAAGAVAGAVSRTATAPLDRIKVYLIASIGPPKDSIEAAKKGNAVAAAKKLGQPLVDATKELWKAGGMRSLFAGKCLIDQTPCNIWWFLTLRRQRIERTESYARVSNQVWVIRSCQKSFGANRRPR
jgi:solute carrier family 25 phosphate transporter 23/24/25/41